MRCRIPHMPSPESLRRLANLTKKVRDDLRTGGMGVNFRYLFRSTAILARVVEILADHVASEAEERQAEERAAAQSGADGAAAPTGGRKRARAES
jgi:hypothetical protein